MESASERIHKIEALMSSGEVEDALFEADSMLQLEPSSRHAKMLYGLCHYVAIGDKTTFDRIYNELAQEMMKMTARPVLWQKYKSRWKEMKQCPPLVEIEQRRESIEERCREAVAMWDKFERRLSSAGIKMN